MSIDTKATFCSAFNQSLQDGISDFRTFLTLCANIAREQNTGVTAQALANASGAWYAWLLVIFGEKKCNELGLDKTFLKLPNVISFPCSKLYKQSLYNLLDDFQQKLRAAADVNLVTSNPDFVILNMKFGDAIYQFDKEITEIDLENYDNHYRLFESKCDLENLYAFVGVKTSLRPDRRIQLLHEGSLMKAIYTHLKTRNWDISAPGAKYFALTLDMTEADANGLRSVATHSIVSASLVPERAVDDVVKIWNPETLGVFCSNLCA